MNQCLLRNLPGSGSCVLSGRLARSEFTRANQLRWSVQYQARKRETLIALGSQLLFCLRKGKICIRRTPLRGRRRRIQRRVAPALTPTGREKKNTVTSNVYLNINLETPCHVLVWDASFRTQQQESRKGWWTAVMMSLLLNQLFCLGHSQKYLTPPPRSQ